MERRPRPEGQRNGRGQWVGQGWVTQVSTTRLRIWGQWGAIECV